MGNIRESRIALFGGTGLLGQELIAELVGAWPHARFDIFARPNKDQSGRSRAEQAARSAMSDSGLDSRVNFHGADLSMPDLGLDAAGKEALLDSAHIVNAAADVSFGMPLSVARARNVESLGNLLGIVSEGRPFIHQISTAYVGHGSEMIGALPPSTDASYRNTYEQSKAEAEMLLAESGLPWRAYRPSIIVGSSRDGRAKSYDTVYVFARALLSGRMPAVPAERTQRLDIVPSDYVARAFRKLTEVGEPGRAYHITAGQDYSPMVGELVESFHRVLLSIDHPAAEWSHPHVLRMFSPTWFDGLLQLPSDLAPAKLRSAAEVARIFLPFVRDDVPVFDPCETFALIDERPPQFSEYACTLWRSALADGFGGSTHTVVRSSSPGPDASNLAELVGRAALTSPESLAVHAYGDSLTFGELHAMVVSVANDLEFHGVRAGVPVVVRPEQSVKDLVLILAATAVNAHLILVRGGDRLPSLCNFLNVEISDDLTTRIEQIGEPQWCEPGLVIATSGTTGDPKWVHHGHDALAGCGWAAARRLNVGDSQRVAIFIPLFHAYAMCVAIPAAWSRGAAIALSSNVDGPYLDDIASSGATHVVGVMEHYQRLLDEMEGRPGGQLPDISSWEVALCGDDPVLPAVWERFENVFRRPLAQGYGLTECLLVAVGVSPHSAGEGMVVRPLPDVSVEIRDGDGNRVRVGAVGEIWVDAPWRMKRQIGGSETSYGAVPTGDDGYLDVEGNLHIIGRRLSGLGMTEGAAPDLRGGPSSIEIEDSLIKDHRVRRVHVLWRGSQPVAFVESLNASRLPDSMMVLGVKVELRPVDKLPRTAVGKVSRRALSV